MSCCSKLSKTRNKQQSRRGGEIKDAFCYFLKKTLNQKIEIGFIIEIAEHFLFNKLEKILIYEFQKFESRAS